VTLFDFLKHGPCLGVSGVSVAHKEVLLHLPKPDLPISKLVDKIGTIFPRLYIFVFEIQLSNLRHVTSLPKVENPKLRPSNWFNLYYQLVDKIATASSLLSRSSYRTIGK